MLINPCQRCWGPGLSDTNQEAKQPTEDCEIIFEADSLRLAEECVRRKSAFLNQIGVEFVGWGEAHCLLRLQAGAEDLITSFLRTLRFKAGVRWDWTVAEFLSPFPHLLNCVIRNMNLTFSFLIWRVISLPTSFHSP